MLLIYLKRDPSKCKNYYEINLERIVSQKEEKILSHISSVRKDMNTDLSSA